MKTFFPAFLCDSSDSSGSSDNSDSSNRSDNSDQKTWNKLGMNNLFVRSKKKELELGRKKCINYDIIEIAVRLYKSNI